VNPFYRRSTGGHRLEVKSQGPKPGIDVPS
jgi:hypothetical protein